jgi:hypothetical protein
MPFKKQLSEKITKENFTRINNDVNGNPRYVIHFLDVLSDLENYDSNFTIDKKYDLALKKTKPYGGKKFNNKLLGGGIVFSTYNIDDLANKINALK